MWTDDQDPRPRVRYRPADGWGILAPQILGADIDLKPRPAGTGYPACAGCDPEVFFPTKAGGAWQAALAKRICRGCPMRELCLEEAIPYWDLEGIWGGTTPRERKVLRMQRRERRSIVQEVAQAAGETDDRISLPVTQ